MAPDNPSHAYGAAMSNEGDAFVLRPISRRDRLFDSFVGRLAGASGWLMPVGWIIVVASAMMAITAIATYAGAWWPALPMFAGVLVGWILLLALLDAVFALLQRCSRRYRREVVFARRIREVGGEVFFVGDGIPTIFEIDLSRATIDDAELTSIAEQCVFLEGLVLVEAPFSRFSPETIHRVKRKAPLFDSESAT